jgi:hypothetical protein
MVFGSESDKFTISGKFFLPVSIILILAAGMVWAQATASIIGAVRDTSGANLPGASVTAKHLETGLTRTTETDANGRYNFEALPVGQYEMSVSKTGFQQGVRKGLVLVVAQQAEVNYTLQVGSVQQSITVTDDVAIVNTTLSSTSGLVGETEVKELPLNGRSFDQLIALNAGITNDTSNRTAGGNAFSVAGRRPEDNRFLLNGVDYPGTNNGGITNTPSGASGQLLGVDAVREFNVVEDTYGAEYGKRAGGQVSIVTSSGTNQLHGSAFEFIRNSVLDARNYFDQTTIAPFKRNQFGGALGGPLIKDKLFLFANYEGFRQRLGISDVAVVPDADARQGMLPNSAGVETPVPGLQTGMLPFFSFWPEPNGNDLGGGLAFAFANPPQKVREDFGLIRSDYHVSAKDSLSATVLVDNGENDLPEANPLWLQQSPQDSYLGSLQETRIISQNIVNVATFGFSRTSAFSGVLPLVPIPASLSFISGFSPGQITIGGGASALAASSVTPAPGSRSFGSIRNLFTVADDVRFDRGRHSFSGGFWFQRVQQNGGGSASSSTGTVAFSTLQTFLQDVPTSFTAVPNPTELGFRSSEIAAYFQDEIKVTPNLLLSLGLRDEMTTGWNEAHGRCANILIGANQVVDTNPIAASSCLTQNNAKSLWQPRIGIAWNPSGKGTLSVRAGFGIYNNLQDNLGNRIAVQPPYNARLTLSGPLLSNIPIPGGLQPPPACNAALEAAHDPCSIFTLGGFQPDFHTPTVQEWSLHIEQQITKDMALQLGYVGSQSYHLPINIDANVNQPQVCASAAGCASGGTAGSKATVPEGTIYMPPAPRPNPYVASTFSWFFEGVSNYNALEASLIKRATRGLTFKANYTYGKVIGLIPTPSSSSGTNEPQNVANPFDLAASKGVAAFSLRHQFNANFVYDLPFGIGHRWGSGSEGIMNNIIGGWQWTGLFTAQSGFPFTPQVGSNISGTGDTLNPDLPNVNPTFQGPIILHSQKQWFNPNAYLLPTAGTFGDVSIGSLTGPRLIDFDTAVMKQFRFSEKWSLQFRAESFNIFNHANFGEPNPIVFSGGKISPSAGVITTTATTSRQLQFALKLLF